MAAEPCPQIAIAEQIPTQQGGPDLDAHRIGAGTDKRFNLEQFEEQFDLSALLVNGGNGGRGQGEVIGQ
jgi:hypothetical protein